uniref:F-box domain-containing protein n=1 Tax=Brassica oleracea var. oleracea TaxID=109376 RepID=A0A0D3ABC8_BRAOL
MHWRSLPGDLVEDILSRVSAIPLVRLRETSKQWNAKLKSGSFAKMHAAHAPKEESLMITLIDHRVCLVKINLHDPSVKVAPHALYLKDPLSDSSKEVDIRNVFHCDGLLLCTTKDKRLVVWNPCSGETKWVKPRDSYKKTDYCALGYDNKSSSKQYKILRLDRQDRPNKNVYEIYDFNSNSWRVLGVATDWFLAKYRRDISVKGNTYWVATQAAEKPYHDFILSFDFSTEMFQNLSLPHPFPYGISSLSVVREEQLCLLGAKRHMLYMDDGASFSDLQVWVITSTGSWNKFLALYNTTSDTFSKGMSFLADEQNQVVVFLNTKNILHVMRQNKHSLEKHLGGKSSVLLNYVPSLAQIQEATLPGGRKRKEPST